MKNSENHRVVYCHLSLPYQNKKREVINPLSANPNGQTHKNNSSATADEVFEFV